MKPIRSDLRIAFSNAIRAFQTGGLSYADFLEEIDRQRTAGVSPDELLAVLKRREYVEPLAYPVHEAVVAHVLLGTADVSGKAAAEMPALAKPEPEPVDLSMDITSPIVPAALQHHGVGPALPSTLEPSSFEASSLEPSSLEPSTPEPSSLELRRRSVFPGIAAVLGLVVVGVGGWLIFRAQGPFAAHPGPVAAQSVPAAGVRSDLGAPRQVRRTAQAGMKILDCPDCPEMVVLPTGHYTQGSNGGGVASSEMPPHRVTIGYLLALSTSDVTVAEFRQFVSATRRNMQGRDMQGCDTYDGEWRARPTASWAHPGFAQTGSHPVTCVSWKDAEAYAQWISQKSGHRYRLPTAAEWEYAAQSDADRLRSAGGNSPLLCTVANVADLSAARRYPGWSAFSCEDGFVYTSPVGTYKPDAFGLSDMVGNVYQWTEDCWYADYAGAPTDGSARTSVDCTEHELRGGSWFSSPRFVRPAARNHFASDYRTSSVGFRLARDVN